MEKNMFIKYLMSENDKTLFRTRLMDLEEIKEWLKYHMKSKDIYKCCVYIKDNNGKERLVDLC